MKIGISTSKPYFFYLGLIIFFMIAACSADKRVINGDDLLFQYEVLAIDLENGNTTVTLTLKNQGNATLESSGWAIYFNQLSGNPASKAIGAGLQLERVQGISGSFPQVRILWV